MEAKRIKEYKFYCFNPIENEVYRANKEKLIQSIMRHHSVDRSEAVDRLYCSDENHPVTLDNEESCWVE